MKIIIRSHGLKRAVIKAREGQPEDLYVLPRAHLYLDARAIPDGVGLEEVRRWIHGTMAGQTFWTSVRLAIDASILSIPKRRKTKEEAGRPWIICTLCAYGVNRSVALKALVAEELEAIGGYEVEVE